MTIATATERNPLPRVSMSRGCLALNASYEPLMILPLKRALRLVTDAKAEIVEVDGTRVIRSAGASMPCPSVIRLVRYVHVPRRFRRNVTNTFMFARDHYRCQYCGRHRSELRAREFLTRDHVLPQSRGGDNSWANCVTACSSCNNRKADRTPRESGMQLLRTPAEPRFVRLVWAVRRLTPLQRKYIEQFFGAEGVGLLSSS
jgi:5-methylcytosine-specific restriction endonuclease McrA